MSHIVRIAIAAAILLALAVVPAAAGSPALINFQGLLKDTGGAPTADSTYSVVFTIYDAPAGGNSVWTETQPVTTKGGLFAILLGAVNPIADSVFNGTTRYLGVAVGGDPEISPRTALVSVPYAKRVGTVDGAAGGNITGKLSIGTGHTNTGAAAFVAGFGNSAGGNYTAVSGGRNNTASGAWSTIGGGEEHTASGFYSTVSGGYFHIASGYGATVGGGSYIEASGDFATVGGGNGNGAIGDYATVPGGAGNAATGATSFAAGFGASAAHDGAFVWGDNSPGYVTSSADNQFTARTSGGARFFSNAALTTGVTMAAGGGSWASVSDRNLKSNFEEVNAQDVLARVAAMPMTTWNYTSQDDSIRHMGPMAQDFRAAFGLGEDDTHITTIDADGVALAAIQGLHQKLKEKDAEIAALRDELAGVKDLVAGLAARLPHAADAQLGMK